MTTRKQFLVTVRIDAFDSEEVEYFFHHWIADGKLTLDTEILSEDNHEVIDWEEITQ